MSYMKRYLEKYEWWKLVPCFDFNEYFTAEGGNYSCAHISDEVYIAYLFDKIDGPPTLETGTFKKLDDTAEYTYQWYDPRSDIYFNKVDFRSENGEFKIPPRPTKEDWVIAIKKK